MGVVEVESAPPPAKDKVSDEFEERERKRKEEEEKIIIKPAVLPKKEEESEEESSEEEEEEEKPETKKKLSKADLKPAVQIKVAIEEEAPLRRKKKAPVEEDVPMDFTSVVEVQSAPPPPSV